MCRPLRVRYIHALHTHWGCSNVSTFLLLIHWKQCLKLIFFVCLFLKFICVYQRFPSDGPRVLQTLYLVMQCEHVGTTSVKISCTNCHSVLCVLCEIYVENSGQRSVEAVFRWTFCAVKCLWLTCFMHHHWTLNPDDCRAPSFLLFKFSF